MGRKIKDINEITYLQQRAAEGEVAYALYTSPHNAEMKYRIYLVLKSLNKTNRPMFVQMFKSYVTFPETEIDRIYLAIENNELPMWLWLERTVADIELALYNSDYQSPSLCNLSIDKKLARESIVVSAFNMFIRTVGLVCVQAAEMLCKYIMEETNLEILYPTCCYMLSGELAELKEYRPPKSLIDPSILDMSFDPKDLMSYNIETKAIDNLDKAMKKLENENVLDYISSDDTVYIKPSTEIRDELSDKYGIRIDEMRFHDEEDVEEGTKFVVKKTFNGSNISTTLKSFDTQEEAMDFVKKIEENSPEIMKLCTLEILKEKKKQWTS